MAPDDELCLCFHVTWRKVINYIRVHSIVKPSLLHECSGAGTGCGWCRKQLAKLTDQVAQNPPSPDQRTNSGTQKFGSLFPRRRDPHSARIRSNQLFGSSAETDRPCAAAVR
jgi:bacterioferritin-associated ferredoxin